jgi:cell fate (sporulation/competence/biofilm development) regulator YlbF (YheA/YmcA/DUF963 family)
MSEKDIIKKAEKLGKEIGKSKLWKDFVKARDAFKEDEKLQELLKELQEKEQQQEEKLNKGVPIEVEEKKALKNLEQEISSSKIFIEFVSCENKYLSLVKKIDEAIKKGTDEESKDKKQ